MDLLDIPFFLSVFVTLFVIVDPPGTIPIFMALTNSMTQKQRTRAAWTAVGVAMLIIVLFALFGQFILSYMHISLDALRISGGLLLLIIALQLLTGKEDEMAAADGVNVALVPLGTPLLGGPGAIVAVMLFVQQADGNTPKLASLTIALLAIALMMFLFMRFSSVISRLIGQGGVTLVTRIAGVLLAAISVQMMLDGFHQVFIDWGLVAATQ
ncbi:MAG: MarC family protein [Dermabacter sp.]|nr:MarC family protein [Dermabacter sp.]